MRKIINWILLLGTIISVSIALKYSALPVPEFMSEKLAGFWITTIEEQQQYVLLYDVAVGFMLSALFYFVVDEIPDRVRMYKAKTLIEVPINQLLEHMEQLISVVLAKYERNQCLKELSQKDFFVLDGENQISMEEISYLTTTYYVKNCKKKTAIHQYGTVNKLVKENLKQIVDNISNIKNYEYFYASDNLFVEYIRQIEGCKLIQWYLDGNANDKTKNIPCFRYATTSNAMFEFVELYLCLLKHKFHTEYSVTTLDTKEETDKYHMKRESGAMLQEVVDLQNERKNKALHNLTAVISSSKYTTNILVSQLKKELLQHIFQ